LCPHEKQRASRAVLPTEDEVASEGAIVEIRVEVHIRIRGELVGFWTGQFLEVLILSNGYKGLHVEFQAEHRGENHICASGRFSVLLVKVIVYPITISLDSATKKQ
jgi:hypothetical protein